VNELLDAIFWIFQGVKMHCPISKRNIVVTSLGLAIAILTMAGVYFLCMAKDNFVTTTPTGPDEQAGRQTESLEDRLEKLLGQEVAFEGLPRNYVGHAQIEVPALGTRLFVPGIEWPQNILGKTVLVSGTLHKRWYIPQARYEPDFISAGANAPWYGIEQAKWKVK
jgi:hypothetical protein